MTARETMKHKLTKLGRQSGQERQVRLSLSAVSLGAETAIYFLLSAVLAGAELPEDCAPFGVAMVAAAGSGLRGAGALLGSCFGYLCMLGFSQGLRHASAAVLTFAVAFAFYDIKWFRRPWVMPVLGGAFTFFTGSVLLAQSGWGAAETSALILEGLLTAGTAWCYRGAMTPLGQSSETRLCAPAGRRGLLVLVCTLLMALEPVELWEGISLGRTLAVLAVLCGAWQGGMATGAVAGVVLGSGMDLVGGGTPMYAMVLGMSGLMAGLCRGSRRFRAALVYVLSDAGAVLATWNRGVPLEILYEVFLASMAFLLLPQRSLRRLGVWLAPDPAGPADVRAQKIVQEKLEATARAFRTLGDSLKTAFRPPRNDNDVSVVFDRAAGRVCRGCSLMGRCWKQDYTTTFNALNDATPAMVERGRAEAGDFPRHFTDRCLHFPAFLEAVNQELTALFYRRQYNARVRESRAAVCRQYAQLSDLLGTAAAELSRELVPDPVGERRLRQKIAELGLDVRAAVFRDSRGMVRIEAEGPGCAALVRGGKTAELSALLGVPLRLEQEGKDSLSLLQEEPLMAVAGVAARKKSGETVSGDAGTYFKRADGKLYVLLCDGMGSGPEANRESTLAVRLLEQLLQAGVESRQALTTLSSALALRGEEAGGFTTVDLLELDLFTGEGELYKLGAAPTYVKKKEGVQRLSGASLPAGLGEGDSLPLDHFSLRLAPGDSVLMVSDGVCGGEEDGWVRERLAAFDGASPKDLARDLITGSPQQATDDSTALVIRLEKRR